MQQVSATFVNSVIVDRRTLHGSIVRNQLFVPRIQDKIMTVEFMMGSIGFKKFWLPYIHEIRLLNCADPPSKQVVADALYEIMINHPIGETEA